MADADKDIVITPNTGSSSNDPTIEFTGGDNNTITLSVLDNATLSVDGTVGQLFSITDSSGGTIFSVNDVSGIPSIEVDDDGTVRLAEFAGNVLVGTATDDGSNKLQVDGNIDATNMSATTFTGALSGNASTATTLQTARTISLGGVLSGSASFNGSSNITITASHTSDPTITLTGAVTGSGTMTNMGNVSISTTATADPTLTLSGDASGSATFTNLGNATLSVTVADDSHNHNHSDGDFDVNGLLTGGIGAATTSGTEDWNHVTNARSGQGHTLLLGTATNGPSSSGYYHPFSFEYNNKDGSGNMTQFAIPYNSGSVHFRTRYNGSWAGWYDVWTSGNDGSGSGLDADLLDGQHGSSYLRSDTSDTFTTLSGTQLNLGSQVQLAESSDRADLLQITSTTSSWGGLQIRNSSNEGRWSFMTDGATAGIYDDENGDWHIQMSENAGVTLYHNGVANFTTGATYMTMARHLSMNNYDIYGVDQLFHHGDTNTYMQFHASDQWRVVTGGFERLEVNNSQITSTLQIQAPDFNATSDISLKENVTTIDNALDKVTSLRGVEFDWKETGIHSVGFVAQEVEEIIPELVATREEDGIKSVRYGNVTALLVEAVKDQQAIINKQSQDIDELKKLVLKLMEK